MSWVLFLWLAGTPGAMVPLEYHDSRRACEAAKKREVDANVALGLGGGATYVCLRV